MSKRSYLDRAEFCDVNGEYSGSVGSDLGWIDALADKSAVHNVGDGIEESLEGFGWLVGYVRTADADMQF